MVQNENNRLAKVRQAFFTRFTLAIDAGYLSAVRDVPWAVLLDNRVNSLCIGPILPPRPFP